MRDTIASGIGSLLLVMASHVRRCTTSWADAPFHFPRLPAGSRTDSGGEPDYQDDLARVIIGIGDDLVDQQARDPLLHPHLAARRIPHPGEIRRQRFARVS